jgi:hypothetical protein
MIDKNKRLRLASATGGAMVGGIGGAMLAALGHAMGSSPMGVGATIVVATLFGACLARVSGAIMGAIFGALFAAFGWVIGGSVLGVLLTIFVCAFVGGWIDWVNGAAKGGLQEPRNSFRLPLAKITSVYRLEYHRKELALWN